MGDRSEVQRKLREHKLEIMLKCVGPHINTAQKGARMIELGKLLQTMYKTFEAKEGTFGMGDAAITAMEMLYDEVRRMRHTFRDEVTRMKQRRIECKRLHDELDKWDKPCYQCTDCKNTFTYGEHFNIEKKEVEDEDEDYCECCGRGEYSSVMVDICPICDGVSTIRNTEYD